MTFEYHVTLKIVNFSPWVIYDCCSIIKVYTSLPAVSFFQFDYTDLCNQVICSGSFKEDIDIAKCTIPLIYYILSVCRVTWKVAWIASFEELPTELDENMQISSCYQYISLLCTKSLLNFIQILSSRHIELLKMLLRSHVAL